MPLYRHLLPILLLAGADYSTSSPWSTSDRLSLWKRKGIYVHPRPPPPPLDRKEVTSLWMRLPAVNRQRLMGRRSQLRERQLLKGETAGEENGHASASRQ